MVKLSASLLSFLLASTAILGAQAKSAESAPIVAVFDIENRGSPLTPEELIGLTDYLSTKLSEGGSIHVIPRDEIRKRITKQKVEFKKECFDSNCQIAIGRELAAEFSINSSISRIGTNCIITSQLFELQKATSVDAASARKSCNPDALIEGIEEIANRFVQSVGKRTNQKPPMVKRDDSGDTDAKLEVTNPIDQMVKATKQFTSKISPSSGITVVEQAPKIQPKTGWSLGAGISGIVLSAASGSIGLVGIVTDKLDLTLPLCLSSAALQVLSVPIIKLGSKSAKGDGVWGSTGVEVTAWITYGFSTAFWALGGIIALDGSLPYDKAGDTWSNNYVLLYMGTILGTVSSLMMSIDSLLAYGQASRLLSEQSSSNDATGVSISPSISPLPAPAQNPDANGMVFGVVGRF